MARAKRRRAARGRPKTRQTTRQAARRSSLLPVLAIVAIAGVAIGLLAARIQQSQDLASAAEVHRPGRVMRVTFAGGHNRFGNTPPEAVVRFDDGEEATATALTSRGGLHEGEHGLISYRQDHSGRIFIDRVETGR